MRWIRTALLTLVIGMGFGSMPAPAYAAYILLQCDANGDVVAGTALFNAQGSDNQGQAEAPDGTYGEGACEYQGLRHIFSQVICDFVTVLNQILGTIYCGIQHALTETLSVLLSLYIAVFGAQLLIGTAQLNSKDIMLRLFKIALVWTFATQSAWGINMIFYFAIGIMGDFTTWIINAIPQLVLYETDGTTLVCEMDPVANGDLMPIFKFFDCLIYYIIAGAGQAANIRIIGFFTVMMVAFPPMSLLALWWAKNTFFAVVRSLISFLMALAALAFLVSLTPVFFSLMLFQATHHFFENWVRYMIAYVVQVIIVFAVIVMWIMIFLQFLWFFDMLAGLIFPYIPLDYTGPVVSPQDVWGICPPQYSTNASGAPTAVCPPGFDPFAATNENGWEDDARRVIPPEKIINQGEFLYFVFYHLVSLIIVTYAFGVLLENAAKIATAIAGPAPLPSFLGGFGHTNWGGATGHTTPQAMRPTGLPGRQATGGFHNMVGNRGSPG